jgi:hypothetical protein
MGSDNLAVALIACGAIIIVGGFVTWITLPSLAWQERAAMLKLPRGNCDLFYAVNEPNYDSMTYNTYSMDNVTATYQTNTSETKTALVSLTYPPPGYYISTEAECNDFLKALPAKQSGQQIIKCYIDVQSGKAYVNPASKSNILGILISGVVVAVAAMIAACCFCYVNSQ